MRGVLLHEKKNPRPQVSPQHLIDTGQELRNLSHDEKQTVPSLQGCPTGRPFMTLLRRLASQKLRTKNYLGIPPWSEVSWYHIGPRSAQYKKNNLVMTAVDPHYFYQAFEYPRSCLPWTRLLQSDLGHLLWIYGRIAFPRRLKTVGWLYASRVLD